MNNLSQRLQVLSHLQHVGTLNPVEAGRKYEIGRLAGRIMELRRAGYDIKSEKTPGKSYATYRLISPNSDGIWTADNINPVPPSEEWKRGIQPQKVATPHQLQIV